MLVVNATSLDFLRLKHCLYKQEGGRYKKEIFSGKIIANKINFSYYLLAYMITFQYLCNVNKINKLFT